MSQHRDMAVSTEATFMITIFLGLRMIDFFWRSTALEYTYLRYEMVNLLQEGDV